jgi:hypothetical protein
VSLKFEYLHLSREKDKREFLLAGDDSSFNFEAPGLNDFYNADGVIGSATNQRDNRQEMHDPDGLESKSDKSTTVDDDQAVPDQLFTVAGFMASKPQWSHTHTHTHKVRYTATHATSTHPLHNQRQLTQLLHM